MLEGIQSALRGFGPASWWAARSRGESAETTDLLAVRASSEATAEIGITTRDGDTVTLSLASEVEVGYAWYEGAGPAPGSELEARMLVASASRELEVTVQGSLDREEMADIVKLVRELGRAIRAFFRGDAARSAERALQVEPEDTLAGFTLDLERSTSLTLVGASLAAETGAPGGATLAGGKAALPLPAVPATDEAAGVTAIAEPEAQPDPAAPATDGTAGPVTAATAPDLTWLLEAIRERLDESGLDPDRAGFVVAKSLQRMIHGIARETTRGPERAALHRLAAGLPGLFSRAGV